MKDRIKGYLRERNLSHLNHNRISPNYLLAVHPQLSKYSIGKFSYGVAPFLEVANTGGKDPEVRIGRFCSIAKGVNIVLNGGHRPDWVTTYPFSYILDEFKNMNLDGMPYSKGDVLIGNDVWIGMNVTILSGVTIGDGAIVGAGSLVTKDVEPYAIVAGNPAHLIRKRFDQVTIDKLLAIKWWNWDMHRIRENMSLLLSNRVDEFIKKNG